MTMPPNRNRRTAQLLAGLLAAQLLLVAAFVLPAHKPEPHGVPVGVAGPPAAAGAAERALTARGGAFEVHRYADAVRARAAIERREVYGAVVPAERTVLVSSAASPAIAQLLAAGAASPAGPRPPTTGAAPQLRVRDVVPIAAADPRGATINLAFLPLIVICLPLVALLARLELRPARLLAALTGFAVLSGLLVVALIGGVLGALPGPYLALSAVAALIVLAVALPTAGFMRVLGAPGIGLGALLFLVIGNPGSGNATAPELLPGFWRVAGQLLPPGSGGQALRNVAYFDGHALAQPLLVLGAWALLGAALLLVARRRAPAAPVAERREPQVAVAA
jgi:prepilin-type processing-associated H-X9-DG protein